MTTPRAGEVRSTSRVRNQDQLPSTPPGPLGAEAAWGDMLTKHARGTFRVGFLNIGGFPVNPQTGQAKEQDIHITLTL